MVHSINGTALPGGAIWRNEIVLDSQGHFYICAAIRAATLGKASKAGNASLPSSLFRAVIWWNHIDLNISSQILTIIIS